LRPVLPRVRHERPGVELRGSEQQHNLGDAVLRDDHHPVAASHTPFAQLLRGRVHGLEQLCARQPARVFDQRDMLRIARRRQRRNLGNAAR
jgi:hypothetical protein